MSGRRRGAASHRRLPSITHWLKPGRRAPCARLMRPAYRPCPRGDHSRWTGIIIRRRLPAIAGRNVCRRGTVAADGALDTSGPARYRAAERARARQRLHSWKPLVNYVVARSPDACNRSARARARRLRLDRSISPCF